MKTIPLTQGFVATVDDDDFAEASKFNWSATKRGRMWYAVARVDGKVRYLHRWLLGEPGGLVDHQDRDGLNNQRGNLRLASHGQNHANVEKSEGDFSSSFKGVSWEKSTCRWKSYATIQGRPVHLGRFDFAHEAALAYDRAARREWGQFANLNFKRAGRDNRTTVLFVGWGRSGKDLGAELLAGLTGLRYGFSFSRVALPFMCEVLGQDEETAWAERHNHREFWKSHLDHLRDGDETLLAEMALCRGEILAGLRDKKELIAVRVAKLFKHILWVDRPGIPADPTTTFGPEDADEVIRNDGTVEDYRETLRRWVANNL